MQTVWGLQTFMLPLPSNEHSCVIFDICNGKPGMLASCGTDDYPVAVWADNIHTGLPAMIS